MALVYHPTTGTIVICDYNGLEEPEMVKRRLSVVISPDDGRYGLCTLVPLSTTEPDDIKPYHHRIEWDIPFPAPYASPFHWVKGDMIYTMSFSRLSFPFDGKDDKNKRKHVVRRLTDTQLKTVRECVLNAIDLSYLTAHL